MAKVRTPRGAWVHAALQALAAGGPDAVRVETLAASLGVSKDGFYWHFADRQALIGEMLDTWEKTGTQDIIARVESQPGDARARLWKLLEITAFCADEDDVEIRSMTAYSMVIGSYFVVADHGGKSRSQVLRLAIERLLRRGPLLRSLEKAG